MPDVSAKETIMVMEVLPVSSRLYGNIGETARREVGGKPVTLLVPKKAGNLQWKTVKYSAGTATPKQCRANNPKFFFLLMLSLIAKTCFLRVTNHELS
jgi:hypothetical protein